MDLELIKGFVLGDQLKISKRIAAGEEWQLYITNKKSRVLLVTEKLADKWTTLGLVDSVVFKQISIGEDSYLFLSSPFNSLIEPIEGASSPHNKIDALSFAVAMRETRRIVTNTSFHDAIYIERYSRLLPTWTITPNVSDDIVLGSWLTGGVTISVNSFRRICGILSWLSSDALKDIIKTAGLPIAEWESHCNGHHNGVTEVDEKFSLPGRNDLEIFMNDYVVDIVRNPMKYKLLGVDFPAAILLYGPSGSGKTYAAEKLVDFLDWPSFRIDSSGVGSPYIHETSKKISEVFDKAASSAPSIVLIDEMESFLSSRQASNPTLHHIEEVGEFLRKIPQARDNHVLIIAMTNMLDCIDPAILRKGRFDHIIEVKMPSFEEVSELLVSLLGKIPTDEDVNAVNVANKLIGRAMSDITYVVREAGRIAAKADKSKVDQLCIDEALLTLPQSEDTNRRIGFALDFQGG